MRPREDQLQVIVGAIDMAGNQLTRCSDPRVTTGIKQGPGWAELHFPSDFRVMGMVTNPSAANFSSAVNMPSANNPGDPNTVRVNTQSPPNTTNADPAVLYWAAFGYGGGN